MLLYVCICAPFSRARPACTAVFPPSEQHFIYTHTFKGMAGLLIARRPWSLLCEETAYEPCHLLATAERGEREKETEQERERVITADMQPAQKYKLRCWVLSDDKEKETRGRSVSPTASYSEAPLWKNQLDKNQTQQKPIRNLHRKQKMPQWWSD